MVNIFNFKSKKRQNENESKNDERKQPIPLRISVCEKLVKDIFGNSSDIVIQSFNTVKEPAMIIYVDGLVNKDLIDRDILKPLKANDFTGDVSLSIKAVYTEAHDIDTFVNCVMDAQVAVFYENSKKVYIVEFRGWDKRGVSEPDAENVIRGPKEGFNESIRTNTALLRRKIKTPKLILESLILGKQSKTSIVLAYIEGIVNEEVLKELKKRISKINTDIILESGNIEQYIDEHNFLPISSIGITQKPDVAAMRIAEGRVAILCDGTPHVLTVPELFIENIHTAEDYYFRSVYSTIIRILRVIAMFISVMLPGLAVAIITYNEEMIPSVFLTSIITATQKTPMPVFAEVFLLSLMFELLREAGTRMPKSVGSAITIVGSLIIGEAAVSAGIVSAPIVIIVALTAVTSFMIPNLLEFILIYRTFYWLLGTTMGLIGIGAGFFIMMTQLISTDSFGIPILSSFSKNELKDSVLKLPFKSLRYRPTSIAKNNIKRRG
ncbi:MAG: spore germination protein [Eubacteriales bacterium]